MAAVAVAVKFFASGRELAGTDGFVLQLPADDANTEAVMRVRLPSPHRLSTPCLPLLQHVSQYWQQPLTPSARARVSRCVRW